MTDCHADVAYLPQRDLSLQHSADHESIMADLALGHDCGHHDYENKDKDNKTDVTSGGHETDVTDTIVTARKGYMTDGALRLTSTTRKDILHDPCTNLGGPDRTRQDCSRRHGTTQNNMTQSDMTERAGRNYLTQDRAFTTYFHS